MPTKPRAAASRPAPSRGKRRLAPAATAAAAPLAPLDCVGQTPPKADAWGKVIGRTQYTDDFTEPGMLHGLTIRSSICRGALRGVRYDPEFDWSGFTIVTARDLPAAGRNVVKLIEEDQPFLAADRIEHRHEPVALLAHADPERLLAARRHVLVDAVEEPAETDYRTATTTQKKYRITKGDLARGFAEADVILEGEYETPHQEQLYIEPQAMIARVEEDGTIHVRGSLQCPFYVDKALAQLFGVPAERVRVEQVMTGGGFGGKEEYPSILAGHCALLAWKSGRPVKMLYDREEDVKATTKRHPSRIRVRSGAKKTGELTALEIDVLMDGGAYVTLTPVVLSRGAIHAAGPYRCDHTTIAARAVKTNTPPNGAFRGFGAPQTCFGIEMHMNRLAERLGLDPLELRRRNLLRIGDTTATGQVLHESVSTDAVVEATARLCDYAELRKKARAFNRKKGPYRYGIGVATFYHGAGFTGAGEVYLASRASVELGADGVPRVLAGSTEIGQGAQTIFAQFAAEALDLPTDAVEVAVPDTRRVPDSGPTVASRTTMVVGGLVYDAARQLREQLVAAVGNGWKGADEFRRKARKFVAARGGAPVVCTAGYQKPPDITWDEEHYRGAAYACFGWAAFVAEVMVDLRTLETRLLRVTTAQDVGRAIHPILCAGQIEGGTLQALGWGLLEEVVFADGEMKNANLTNYIIPTALDSPPMKVAMIENPTIYSPLGAKGIGEMPMDGPAGAVVAAIADATGIWAHRIPATPERLLESARAQGVALPE